MSKIHNSLRGQGETANLPSWQGDEPVLPWISIDYPYKAVPQERCYRPYLAFLFFRLDWISENRCQRARKASAGLPVYFQIEAVVHLVRFSNLLLWSYDIGAGGHLDSVHNPFPRIAYSPRQCCTFSVLDDLVLQPPQHKCAMQFQALLTKGGTESFHL